MSDQNAFIHPTSIVEDDVTLGPNVKIWHNCHVRSGCVLEKDVSLGKGVFVDKDVTIKEGSRIQNGVNVYKGVNIDKWCFVGPNATFTNDSRPRAGSISWDIHETFLKPGASIGAGAIISHGVTIGAFSLIGAGSVLTTSIPPFYLAFGFPARPVSRICACGESRLELEAGPGELIADCCHKNLSPEVLKLAEEEIKKLN